MMRLLSKTFRSVKTPNLRASKPSNPPPSSPPSKLPIPKTPKASPSSKSRSWSVYLILSTNTPIKTYVGSTNNFSGRASINFFNSFIISLKQHNGELRGGAKASRAGRPWVCACLVRGFHDQSEACQFETKWKTLSRKSPRKRNNGDGDHRSLPLLQHRQAALKNIEGLLECSHLDIDWHLNAF